METWYYKIFDMEFGPVKLEKLIELAKSNSISREDHVRFGLEGQWRRVGTIGQLMAHLPFEPVQRVVSPKPSPIEFSNPASETIFEDSAVSRVSMEATELVESTEVERRWWCRIQDQEYGPVELPTLIEWAATGRLHPEDQVRFGNDPYVLARELPGLFPEPSAVPVPIDTSPIPQPSNSSSTNPMPKAS